MIRLRASSSGGAEGVGTPGRGGFQLPTIDVRKSKHSDMVRFRDPACNYRVGLPLFRKNPLPKSLATYFVMLRRPRSHPKSTQIPLQETVFQLYNELGEENADRNRIRVSGALREQICPRNFLAENIEP